MNIQNARILITGGSSGIGKATAIALVKKGAKVAITGRDKKKLDNVAESIGAHAIHADVSRQADVNKTYDKVDEMLGGIDILINNAGIAGWASIDKMDIELMKKVYETNVFGVIMMGQKASERFIAQKKGHIINIASTASLKGFAMGSIYASSKFALRGITQCWQSELRKYNIRVIQINPSEVPTAFGSETRIEKHPETNKLSSSEIAHAIVSSLEMDDRGFIPELNIWATNPF